MTKFTSPGLSVSQRAGSSRRLSLKKFNLCLLGLTAGIFAFYLVNISDLTVQGFVLRDLKTQASTLAGAVAENEAAVSAAQSYNSLSGRVQKIAMVAVGNVEYLSVPTATVARR